MSALEPERAAVEPVRSAATLAKSLVARVRAHGREAFLVGLGHLLALVGNFAGVKLLTHLLAPEAYGELALGMTAAGVIFSLGYSPLTSAMMRFYPIYASQGELPVHVAAFRRAGIRLTLSIGLLALLGAAIIGVATKPHWSLLVVGGALYAMGNGISVFYVTYSTAIRRRGSLVLYQWVDTWARPLCALAALLIFGRAGVIALAGYAVAGLLNAVVQGVRGHSTPAFLEQNGRAITGKAMRSLTHELFIYALPMSVTALFSSVSSYGDRWTLQGLLGSGDLGIYAALCQIGTVPSSLVSSMIGAFILPICFERAGSLSTRAQLRASIRLLVRAILLCMAIALPVLVISAVVGSQIMSLLTARSYSGYASQLWIVVLAGFVLAMGRMALTAVEILRQTGHQLLPWIINAAVTVALSILLGARYGVRGVIAALLLSNLCGAIVCFWIAWRLVRARLTILPA